MDEKTYKEAAFSCNIGIFTPYEQEVLYNSKVAIAGLGGVGGTHLITCLRQGISKFKIADFDTYELKNLNRQYGARIPTIGKDKLSVMLSDAKAINPFAQIETFPEGISEENIDEFLYEVNLVIDALDFFAIDIRLTLYSYAQMMGIPVLIADPLGYCACLLIFHPQKGYSFTDYFNFDIAATQEEKALLFGLGLAPRPLFLKYVNLQSIDIINKKGPSNVATCYLCSAMMTAEIARILLNKPGLRPVPHYTLFDLHLQKLIKGYLIMGNKNPIQKLKFYFLKKRFGI